MSHCQKFELVIDRNKLIEGALEVTKRLRSHWLTERMEFKVSKSEQIRPKSKSTILYLYCDQQSVIMMNRATFRCLMMAKQISWLEFIMIMTKRIQY